MIIQTITNKNEKNWLFGQYWRLLLPNGRTGRLGAPSEQKSSDNKDIQKTEETGEQCSVHPGCLFDIGDDKLPNYMGLQ